MIEWLEARGAVTITAHVHPDHAASQRVAERAGLVATDEVEDGERVWRRGVSAHRAGAKPSVRPRA
jgi:RimJ/RimL family protein N-acetyltransferase